MIFIINVQKNSAFLSSIFVVTFLCLLLYFWLVIFHVIYFNINKENEFLCERNIIFFFSSAHPKRKL
jgi:hypothetical protein